MKKFLVSSILAAGVFGSVALPSADAAILNQQTKNFTLKTNPSDYMQGNSSLADGGGGTVLATGITTLVGNGRGTSDSIKVSISAQVTGWSTPKTNANSSTTSNKVSTSVSLGPKDTSRQYGLSSSHTALKGGSVIASGNTWTGW